MAKVKSNTPVTPFKKFLVGGKWDDVFQLPPFAFKLWLYYYRLEGRTREGWMKREHIAAACGMTEDTVTLWREYLVKHGWLKCVSYHYDKGQEGLKGIPVMCAKHGVIVKVTRNNKGWKNVHKNNDCTGTTGLDRGHSSAPAPPVKHCTGTTSPVCTGTTGHNVDVKQIKPYVDGESKGLLGDCREDGSGETNSTTLPIPCAVVGCKEFVDPCVGDQLDAGRCWEHLYV